MFGFGKKKKRINVLEEYVGTLLAKNEMLENKAIRLERALNDAKKPRRKNRKQLSHKTGFTRVGEVESYDIYQMYQNGMNGYDIARTLDRSQSCVSKHIRKHLEE